LKRFPIDFPFAGHGDFFGTQLMKVLKVLFQTGKRIGNMLSESSAIHLAGTNQTDIETVPNGDDADRFDLIEGTFKSALDVYGVEEAPVG
jgi:hypothetical protein